MVERIEAICAEVTPTSMRAASHLLAKLFDIDDKSRCDASIVFIGVIIEIGVTVA
jgi:hypothetical protein